jgi:hypothetical protein
VFVSSGHVDYGTQHAGLLSMNAILVGNKESPKNLQTTLMIMQRVGDWHCRLQSTWFRFLHRFQATTFGYPFGKSAYLVPILLSKYKYI